MQGLINLWHRFKYFFKRKDKAGGAVVVRTIEEFSKDSSYLQMQGFPVKVVEYSPQKRSIFVMGNSNAKFLQFPYMIFAFQPYSRLNVGFMKEPWHETVDVYFPSLPNIYDDWRSCQEITPHFNTTLRHFWQTLFSGTREFRGGRLITNDLGGWKAWENMDLDMFLLKMNWKSVPYDRWLFQGKMLKTILAPGRKYAKQEKVQRVGD